MSGTRPRQRAAIALSFGVQAVLIAGALALPAHVSSTASISSSAAAVPAPVALLPAVEPLSNSIPFQPGVSVTFKIGAVSGSWTEPGGAAVYLIEPGPDVTATVTLTLPDGYAVRGLWFTMTDRPQVQDPSSRTAAAARFLLSVPALSGGTHTFTLPLGNLAPRSGESIIMTAIRPGYPEVSTATIAELVTSWAGTS
jgi:hypothetical protein